MSAVRLPPLLISELIQRVALISFMLFLNILKENRNLLLHGALFILILYTFRLAQ